MELHEQRFSVVRRKILNCTTTVDWQHLLLCGINNNNKELCLNLYSTVYGSPVQMSLVSVCCVIELSNSRSPEYYIQVMYEALISDWISATRRLHANSWTYKSNKTAKPLRKHTQICRMRSEKNFLSPPPSQKCKATLQSTLHTKPECCSVAYLLYSLNLTPGWSQNLKKVNNFHLLWN